MESNYHQDYPCKHIPKPPMSTFPGIDNKMVIPKRPIFKNEWLSITEQEIEEKGIRRRFGIFWFLWCMFRY